jgi:hypothetical protein
VKDAAGGVSQPSETTVYPVFDPTSVIHRPVINGYWGLQTAGKAYAVVRAQDSDGAVDRSIDSRPGDAVGVADRVDAGGGSIEDQVLRSKIITFYVNHPPQLARNAFYPSPRPNELLTSRSPTFNMPATDDDWFDPFAFNHIGGTPKTYGPSPRARPSAFARGVGDAFPGA